MVSTGGHLRLLSGSCVPGLNVAINLLIPIPSAGLLLLQTGALEGWPLLQSSFAHHQGAHGLPKDFIARLSQGMVPGLTTCSGHEHNAEPQS